MAAYDLEEQEQLAELKAWWKQNGNLVTGIVTAAALGVLAWQGWNWYQRNQAAQASGVYTMLQRAALDKDSQKTKTAAGELLAKFGGTSYAPLGALTAAKALYEAGDVQSAKAQLSWVAENGRDELKDLGRLRLASVLLDEKAYDEALKVLAASHGAAFEARYAELKGDVLSAQGKRADAAAAYRAALGALEKVAKSGQIKNTLQSSEANAPYREMLQQKLDAQGDAK
jgi:predicted negative regulator of RcsB-dependent stress response